MVRPSEGMILRGQPEHGQRCVRVNARGKEPAMDGEVVECPRGDGSEVPPQYVAPLLEEVGEVAALTNGTSFDDTADRKLSTTDAATQRGMWWMLGSHEHSPLGRDRPCLTIAGRWRLWHGPAACGLAVPDTLVTNNPQRCAGSPQPDSR
ncbi:MAG: lasso RiPP family leader peptide-containing protein [Actinophytocola sp.]|nr:lasso RiPP family leader peptide-containing protein [Actinophytocola sp.]